MALKQPSFDPEDASKKLSHIPETKREKEASLDRPEQLLKAALKREVQSALNGLGENIEEERSQNEAREITEQLSPEEHGEKLAEATLGAEWTQRRADGKIAQKEVDIVLRDTLAEMKKRGLGFERSPFNI